MYRVTKLRWRRRVRQRKQQVADIGSNTEQKFDKHFIRRIVRLMNVRRFLAAWLLVVILLGGIVVAQTRALIGYYQELRPIPGGIYTEGSIGSLTNANPLFASSMVDTSVAKLVFAGLVRYDDQNKLVGDLAQSWTLNPAGTVYTFKLRPNLMWHDNKPLTADDVVFTFQTAQNPDVKSTLFQVWREATIKKVDASTVSITLKAPFAPFIYSLTTGIIPKHLLSSIDPSQLRSAAFNTNRPIGAGPFMWRTLEISGDNPENREQSIGLVANDHYHLGKPKLDSFVLKTYLSNERLLSAFHNRQVDGVVGLDAVPDEDSKSVRAYETPLTAIQMAFFLTDSGVLKDVHLRSALVQAVDVPALIAQLNYPVIKADEPFLRDNFAYDPTYKQSGLNVTAANKLLDEAGWARGNGGQRSQNGEELLLHVVGKSNADNKIISRQLQQAWAQLGVKVEVVLQGSEDLQASIDNRSYDVLLNAISLRLDPDVYAFWHSSQADPRSLNRLNFSNYKSETADKSLDSGRSRVDPALRSAKYKPFLQAWQADKPALALYQPRFLYITRGDLFGYEPKSVNTSVDRLNNVHNWMIRQANVPVAR